MNRQVLDFWVGLFVAVGIAATVFIALQVANLTTLQRGAVYTVQAEFDNIGGLKVRAPVKSAGVTVGRVSDIRYDSDQHKAVVSLAIDSQYQFSADTSLSILTSGLLGEQYIGVQSGSDAELLQDGDVVWLTSSAIVLENLIGEVLFNRAQDGGTTQ
ncbi:MAG: outer membrane lipid asymmetry maintenance protein MlaD [Porticoccaceae bacterium]|jgi:phospholipid/cholesterol/gamma-HCH transport system substrate-binding protein|nr:outer membrane lipid asymmetry maintenance protein MlaD [Porticoccaceae bacterium]MEA3300926.1 outer membrane lipid asymmetry maintenance protein MlaD [Pseudomonadota bacterium]HLS97183.1 outer membrane lipid asymmetry maintenance protein MlaD [Porticoccaceae bacterium]